MKAAQALRASRGVPLPAALPASCDPSSDVTTLLDFAGSLEGEHVLVIGGALAVMCALIGRGCAAAAEVQLPDRPVVEPADIALVPRLDTLEFAARAVALAQRVLTPCGRIVLRDRSEKLARTAAALLRLNGFSAIRVRVVAGATLVSAERPFFGPLLHL
jgi:hypothetical protein